MTTSKHNATGRATNANAKGGRKTRTERKRPTLPRPRKTASNVGVLLRKGEASTSKEAIRSSSAAHLATLESQAQAADLAQTHHLLSRLIYRNRHQHRAQHWWRWLCLLRKGVRLLIANDQQFHLSSRPGMLSGEVSSEAVRKKLLKEQELRAERAVLERWIREVLVPRCWVAFSGVVGDGAFCAVGVALLGVLGGVVAVVGVPTGDGGEDESEVVGLRGGFDVGEVVQRRSAALVKPRDKSADDGDAGSADTDTGGEELEGGRREVRRMRDMRSQERKKTKTKLEMGLEEDEDDIDIDISDLSTPRTPPTTLKPQLQPARDTNPIEKSKTTSKPQQRTRELPVTRPPQPQPKPKPNKEEPAPQRKAKERKKGNAIDDLFADFA